MLAIALQIAGAGLVVAAATVALGVIAGFLVLGGIAFTAGLAWERGW